MRAIARYLNISPGSIYNYCKDKEELLRAIVKSIWLEIAKDRNIKADSFKEAFARLYDSIDEGNRIYPDFLKIHFTSFTNISQSRRAMDEIIRHIKDSLLLSLSEYKAVKNIFDKDFSQTDFVNFIFENMMTPLLRNGGKEYLLKIIDKLIYEE